MGLDAALVLVAALDPRGGGAEFTLAWRLRAASDDEVLRGRLTMVVHRSSDNAIPMDCATAANRLSDRATAAQA